MNDLMLIVSTGWGGAVIVGLILLNSLALAGFWSHQQHKDLQGDKSSRVQHMESHWDDDKAILFFDDWIHRIYFIFTMGCALILVSLPLYPISTRTRFLMWMLLSAATLFGAFRIYLAWQGRDTGLRSLGKIRNSLAASSSENADILQIKPFPAWLQDLEDIAGDERYPALEIVLLYIDLSSPDHFLQTQDFVIATDLVFQSARRISENLRTYDRVCVLRDCRIMIALVGCATDEAGRVSQRLLADINHYVLRSFNQEYDSNVRASIRDLEILFSSNLMGKLEELRKLNQDLLSSLPTDVVEGQQ